MRHAPIHSDRFLRVWERLSIRPWLCFKQKPHNLRMQVTGYSGLRLLPPASDAGR